MQDWEKEFNEAFDKYYPNGGRIYGASPYLQAKSDFKAGYEAAMKEVKSELEYIGGCSRGHVSDDCNCDYLDVQEIIKNIST